MIKNVLKGFIIGIGKIIPGVSGSMLAISLGVYEKVLEIIANLKNITINKFFFLSTIILGALISTSIFSRGVKWLLDNFYFSIMLLFTGLIIGGLPDIYKEVKNSKPKIQNIIIFALALTVSYILSSLGTINLKSTNSTFIYFLLGIIESFSSIIPGISGTAIYMSLGVYDMILDFFGNIYNPTYAKFGFLFGIGILTGTIIIAKIITYLLKNYKVQTYFAILGFMVYSVLLMLKDAIISILETSYNETLIIHVLFGMFFLYFGYKITIKINSLLSNN